MVRRKSMQQDPCPVARTAEIIGDRWALLLVRDAFDGLCRFGDFQRSLGMARNILTDRLQRLVQAGIFSVQPASDGTLYQEYVLSERGIRLFPVIVALRQWGEGSLFAEGEPHSLLVESNSNQPLAQMLPCNQHGQALQPAQTRVKKLTAT